MDIKQEELSNKLLCYACLCVGRNIYKVTNENLKKYYYDILDEVPLNKTKPFDNLLVCFECIVALRKCYGFQQQVQDSFRILQTYTAENLQEYILSSTSTHYLSIHHNSHIDILEGSQETETIVNIKVEDECNFDKDNLKNETVYVRNKECEPQTVVSPLEDVNEKENFEILVHEKLDSPVVVIKTENDCPLTDIPRVSETRNISVDSSDNDDLRVNSCSDIDNDSSDGLQNDNITDDPESDVPLESIKSTNGDKRSGNKCRKRKNMIQDTLKKENGKKKIKPEKETKKVLTIEITYDEMMLEREKELTKNSYISAKHKCSTCIMGFTNSGSYKKHMKSKHSPTRGEYKCPICETIVPSVDSFTKHYRGHMRRYQCSVCDKRTSELKLMYQHYYTMHEISLKEYRCHLCGNVSNSIDTHRYHLDSHKARVACPDCDKTFRHRTGLVNHKLAVHDDTTDKYPCDLCDKVFRWKASLYRHKEIHQPREKRGKSLPYCSLCEMNFASVSTYQRHMKNSLKHVTQDQLRYICDHCHRRFCDKTKLRYHIEEIHLHLIYNCPICSKSYKNQIGLDQHVRNVHRERPKNKMCHHCGRGFSTKTQLESHIRTHTGEKPFICEFCPTTFSQHSNLSKHNKQVHQKYKKRNDNSQQVCKVNSEEPGPGIEQAYLNTEYLEY